MKHNREFEIAWLGLKGGEHVYDFSINDEFMLEHGAQAELHDWAAEVKLRFNKQTNFFLLHFDISGSVTVPCDRCGDDFSLNLWDEFNLMIKLTGGVDDESEPEEEADVVFIPRSETVIDISPWIYEFVMLSIPLHNVHAEMDKECNPKALQLLKAMSVSEDTEQRDIWNGLKNIKIADEAPEPIVNKKKEK